MAGVWRCREIGIPVFDRVHVMGILNVTPDSFYDGRLFLDPETAISHGIHMAANGADLIDVGGESTRPGARTVSVEEELVRVIPVVEGLAKEVGVPVSIDTSKAAVAEAALEAGAVIVNDISGMRFDDRMKKVVAASGAGVILMHMLGEPRTMQENPQYGDVVAEVAGSLREWAEEAVESGISQECIAIDPGIGFGKTLAHNLLLIKHLQAVAANPEESEAPRYPLVLGPSRKSFIGLVLGSESHDRLEGTSAVVAWAVVNGANVVRVHDVEEISKVVRMIEAIEEA